MEYPDDFTEPHDTRMIRKFGSREAFEAVKKSHGLIPRGIEAGLDASVGFTQDNLSRRVQSSTLRSHRLVQWVAREHGLTKSEELYAVLNRKHFTEAAVLNHIETLLDACEEVGLDRTASRTFLLSDQGTKEILDMYDKVIDMGINSIPTVLVNGKFVVSGAARADEYIHLFRKLLADGDTSGGTLFAPLPE